MAGWSKEQNRGRSHYVNPCNNAYRVSMPTTSRGGDRNCHNIKKTIGFKATRHGDNLHKSYDNKINLICEQLNNTFLNQNEQFRNNTEQRSFLKLNNNSRDGGHLYHRHVVCNLKSSSSGWYYIYVQNVENVDETIKKIQTHIAPLVFYPYDKQYFNNAFKFLVDDYKVARKLHNSSFKIKLGNHKLVIKVNEYMPSHSSISFKPVLNDIREKMIIEIKGRYNPRTKNMDLSQFYKCPLFTENQLFVSLNQPAILLAALNIVAQHTKNDVYCLSLKNNHIYLSEGLIWIRRLFPELKVLDLAGNQFTNWIELKCLSGFSIEVLNLSKNPVSNVSCNVDSESYRRDIRKLFPRLQKLDNIEIPTRYCTIASSKLKMPINQISSYYSTTKHCPEQPHIMNTIESFLSQYYELYDNNVSRQLVANTYHENATFSLSSGFLHYFTKGNLSHYLKFNRNLLKSDNKKSENSRFLHRGRENIIHILEELPKTKHDLTSFQVDLPLANNSMIHVVVNGVFIEEFKETIRNIRHVCRSFSRAFFLVPFRDGWRIINDMLFVTIATDELLLETAKRFHVFKTRSTSSKNENFNGNNNKPTIMIENNSEEMFGIESFDQQSATPNNPLLPYQQQPSFSSYQISNPMNPQPQRTSLYQADLETTVMQVQQMKIQQQNISAISSVSPVAFNLKLDSR